ncbi:MAG: hypothetical protein LBU82_01255 [Treponema sp.]|jgi:hypothetical protein|nr:hypothetical protein [Treponema sp.]
MTKKIIVLFIIHLFCVIYVFAEFRSFDSIFPNIDSEARSMSFSDNGYLKFYKKTDGTGLISRQPGAGISPQIANAVLSKNPVYVIESITVVPGMTGAASLLDVYNSLGNIRDLKGRLYHSATRDKDVPLFEDATRIKSEKQTAVIPDPAPAKTLPRSETVYVMLKDVNFGKSYYRGEMELIQNGLSYNLTNFRNLSYLFVPVMKEERFTAQLYFEPIKEGVLIYSIAGADISDFFASKIDVPSAIAKRLAIIVSWASEGISKNQAKTP